MDASIKAVVGGLLWTLVWEAMGTFIAVALWGVEVPRQFYDGHPFVLNLACSCLAGWIIARRAPSSPLTHALVAGLLLGVLSLLGGLDMAAGAIVGALLGGWLAPARAIVKPKKANDATLPA